MAEISDPPESTDDPEPQFNPDSMRKTKPRLKRFVLTLSVLFSFLLGFPILWKSVEIHRAPLPFLDIDHLSSRLHSEPLRFPVHFRTVFFGFAAGASLPGLESYLRDRLAEALPSVSHTVSAALGDSDSLLSVDFDGEDGAVDESLESALRGSKVYTVVVVKRDGEVRSVVGKYRHAWIVGRVSELSAVERAAEIFVGVFGSEGVIHSEFMPVGADGRIVLSFNLINSDPSDGFYDWDFKRVEETMLAPVIEALKPIANISVESQVLYHAPTSSFSSWDDKRGSYIFSTKDLPFFVNSNEWHLDTSVAASGRSKILHFVVYIPSVKECPLLLQLPDGELSNTNGFISPMWGGITVWNPKGCQKISESDHPVRHTISHEDVEKIFEVFVGQLRQLFGLKSDNIFASSSGMSSILASERGFTEWELDILSRKHTCFNLNSCATTLGSLSRLVQSLPRMIIMDEIGKQVHYSLEAAKLAQINASLGVYDASAVASREARSLAEDAFFHPSMMSVSYYSYEHCFAVYSPFFLPVLMHVIFAVVSEWMRYKRENRKYLAWVTKLNKAA